ncbi:MAG TPA: DNA topoisomerase IB [Myxococcales bacterium]|nr:DNA topoisomerase IB [Myxococcales bacterium]
MPATQLERLQRTGHRRLGTPRSGFRYVRAGGRAVSAKDRERIAALHLPPAWTDVFISPSPTARLQAIGKDAAGRWQYRYHPAFLRRQQARKYDRLQAFARALPGMRRHVAADLRRPGLPREKVMACALRILSTCFVRPGSAAYAEENGSIGLATLRPRHVAVRGDTVTFDFPGKSKQRQHRRITDRLVARTVRQMLRVPGKELFKYVSGDGAVVDVRRRGINQYIKEVMGRHFSAKDFRTWAGTLICACALARAGAVEHATPGARRRAVVQAVKDTAAQLGNTPAVCRSSYINPSVLSSFERGQVVDRYFNDVEELVRHRAAGYHASEKALLRLLRRCAA